MKLRLLKIHEQCVGQLPKSDAVHVYIHCGYHGDWTLNDTQTGLHNYEFIMTQFKIGMIVFYIM